MPPHIFINIAIEIIALVTGTYFFKQLKSKFLFLYIFVCFGLLTESLSPVLYLLGFSNNMWLSHIYFPLEFLLLSLLYLVQIKSTVLKKWIRVIIALFILYCIINPLFVQHLNEYSQIRSFSSIILVFFSILYYHQVMIEAKISKLSTEPMIWVNTAVLFYFSINLLYNILFTLVLEYSREFAKLTALYFGISLITFYILITIGFWKAGRQKA